MADVNERTTAQMLRRSGLTSSTSPVAVTGVGAAAQQRRQQRLPELATVANWVKILRVRLRETNIDPEDSALVALRDEVRVLRRDIDGSQALLDDVHDVLGSLFDVDIPER
ncbi:hypothetical protein EXIGLDRAFT_833394 [Exidia glandulosa HHB12029]|uniref:Uncharacterized protein n=1 Tax=Exidia glandulosa HHB12029 TaxID=1314781 RepID=A0A165KSV3_EXIGL|nr:hypothetical protein EXIGLDRAFT_833394 [Exidia glandulosa HHB12029]